MTILCTCPMIQSKDHKRHFKGCALREMYPEGGIKTNNPDDITQEQRSRCKDVLADVLDELKRAKEIYPRPAISPAEGFFWLQEEFDELKEEIYKSPSNRNFALMRKEAVQVAAMAIRFLQECCPKNI